MSGGSKRVRSFTLVVQNLNHPDMMVVGVPPPPYSITWLRFLGATSQKLRARVRGLSRNVYALGGASRKQARAGAVSGAGCPRRLASSCLGKAFRNERSGEAKLRLQPNARLSRFPLRPRPLFSIPRAQLPPAEHEPRPRFAWFERDR